MPIPHFVQRETVRKSSHSGQYRNTPQLRSSHHSIWRQGKSFFTIQQHRMMDVKTQNALSPTATTTEPPVGKEPKKRTSGQIIQYRMSPAKSPAKRAKLPPSVFEGMRSSHRVEGHESRVCQNHNDALLEQSLVAFLVQHFPTTGTAVSEGPVHLQQPASKRTCM